MGRIVAAEYVSIDGVMQDPGGVGEIEYGGWSNPYWNDQLAKLQSDLLFASDALHVARRIPDEWRRQGRQTRLQRAADHDKRTANRDESDGGSWISMELKAL